MQLTSTISIFIALSASAMATALPSSSRAEIKRSPCGEPCYAFTRLLTCSDEWKKNYNICESLGCRTNMPKMSNLCLSCKEADHPCVQLKDGSCGQGTVGLSHLPRISADMCKTSGCLSTDDEIWSTCKVSGQ